MSHAYQPDRRLLERPLQLLLGGSLYKVEYVPVADLQSDESETCDADINFHTQIIRIREDARESGCLRILCHEIAHHYFAWSGMSSALKCIADKDTAHDLEESLCDWAGNMMFEVIRDNDGFEQKVRSGV